MARRPSYARTPLERTGQVNLRNSPDNTLVPTRNGYMSLGELREGDSIFPKSDGSPDCVVFVSKRKGFGTTGNSESLPFPIASIATLKRSFPEDKFYRYTVKVYLKRTGASEVRRAIRGW